MKIYNLIINGKKYSYINATIKIAKNISIKKSTSIGPVESQAKAKKIEVFIKKLKKEESKKRSIYWRKHIKDPKFKKYASIEKIEGMRSNLIWDIEKIGEFAKLKIETESQIEFIINSNQLEGSKIPRVKVEEQILNPSRKIDAESKNTVKAIYFANSIFRFGPILHIKKLQELLLAHEPEKTGIRTANIIVGNSEVVKWENIKKELKLLIDKYRKINKRIYPPKLAFDFYYHFERIHPFLDGNGRTGRLIMNRILKDNGYPPIIIWNQNRVAHMSAFEKRIEGKSEYFYKFMTRQLLKSYLFFQKELKGIDLI